MKKIGMLGNELPTIGGVEESVAEQSGIISPIVYFAFGIISALIVIAIVLLIIRVWKKRHQVEVVEEIKPEPQQYLILKNIERPEEIYKVGMKDSVTIGRTEADIVLVDEKKCISSTHCTIIQRGKLLYLKDNKSTNGTFYQNRRVYGEVPILNGDRIRLADMEFIVEVQKNSKL